jgi:threonine dehydratase
VTLTTVSRHSGGDDSSREERFGVDIDAIRHAQRLLAGQDDGVPEIRRPVALHTPLIFSEPLSRRLSCRVWLKLENLQRTGSYKIRGAFANIASRPAEERRRGLVTASAGNHAQGVAAAASAFGIAGQTTIFVPIGTPKVKQDNTRAFGVEVREVGESFDQAREAAYGEAAASGRAFIEPFDDWNTIAGQGTIGLEIAADLPSTAAIVAPVGGGGLISGIAIAARSVLADANVIGAQAAGSPSMILSLESGAPTSLPYPPSTQIADGIKVSRPGDRPFRVCRELVGAQRFVAVSDIATVGAAADLMVYAKVIAEGAGAVSLGALGEIQAGRVGSIPPFGPEQDVVVVVSGGNIDPSFSWRILYEQTVPNLLTLRVAMPDRPGELLRMLVPIARSHVNIIDIDVNRLDSRPRMGERIVEVCVAIASQAQAETLIGDLTAAGYHVHVSKWQDPAVNRGDNAIPSPYFAERSDQADQSPRIPAQPAGAAPAPVAGTSRAVDLRVEAFRLVDQRGRRRAGNCFLPGEPIFIELELRNAGRASAPANLMTQVFAHKPEMAVPGERDEPEFSIRHRTFTATGRPFRYGSWSSGERLDRFTGSVRSFSRSTEGDYVARVFLDALNETGCPAESTQATVAYMISAGAIEAGIADDAPRVEAPLVVNKRRPLPRDYTPDAMRAPMVVRTADFLLTAEAADATEAMFGAAEQEGIRLRLASGYRSFARQAATFEDMRARHGAERAEQLVARPGHSEHQTGLAIDLNDAAAATSAIDYRFAKTPAHAWMEQNCARFGFILRYPKGKETITGFQWEPWHYRYVGPALARKLAGDQLTLEEYFGIEGGDYPPTARPEPVP